MVNASKLHRRLASDPSQTIAFRDFERLLAAFGFTHARTPEATGTTSIRRSLRC